MLLSHRLIPASHSTWQSIEFPSDAGGNVIVTIGGRVYQSKPGASKAGPDAPTVSPKLAGSRPKRKTAGRRSGRGADFVTADYDYADDGDYIPEGAEADGEWAGEAKRRVVLDFSAAEISAAIASAANAAVAAAGGETSEGEEEGGGSRMEPAASPPVRPVVLGASA